MPSFGMTPYKADVSQDVLDVLRARLLSARWPDELPGSEWEYGVSLEATQELVRYWANDFDWRSFEAKLNQFPQFLDELDGEQVHYLHIPSDNPQATAMILSHGWPGSVVEFLDCIPLLTADFHLVIPSLPGFGFSGPTRTRGVSPQRIAKMWADLMAKLGYQSYLAQGGDWGSVITTSLATFDPEHVAGYHINMVPTLPTGEEYTEIENQIMADSTHFRNHERGYHALQATKPQTIAVALADSPAGLAGWILEKFHRWTDHDGDVFTAVSKDTLCANLMLYWATNTAGSAARIYYEFAKVDGNLPAFGSGVPMGGAIFPKEIYRSSKRWAEAFHNVVHWSEFDHGGHFAALEHPLEFCADLRAFAATVAAIPREDPKE